MAEQWIYWLEELGQEHLERVGRKCAGLGEMTRLGMRVPPGFAISVEGYETFMALTGLGRRIGAYFEEQGADLRTSFPRQLEASRAIQEMVRTAPMPAPMAEAIASAYRTLCEQWGAGDLAVAVRSSGAVSMPGQMETFLNVRGEEDVVRKVQEVWESTFNNRALAFRLEKGMPADKGPIGVAVIKMVNARSAGVALTVAPTTGDTGKVVIEGTWGLGESVVSGEITPDHFVVDKETREIERSVSRKARYVVFDGRGTAKADVPEPLQAVPCLEDREILEIARIAQDVEAHYGLPQDTEWVIDKDLPFPESLFWVQARPAKYTARKKDAEIDYLIEQMVRLFRSD